MQHTWNVPQGAVAVHEGPFLGSTPVGETTPLNSSLQMRPGPIGEGGGGTGASGGGGEGLALHSQPLR